jgi:hypothetical protein
MLFRSVGEHGPCRGVIHQKQETPARASWEVRFYQDTEMLVTLYEQGKPQQEITQILWDLACEEQDTVGLVCHKTMFVCSECSQVMISPHVWDEAAFLTMTNAQVRGCALLVVTDRLTEQAAIINNVPSSVQEENLLSLLKDEDMLHVQFQP